MESSVTTKGQITVPASLRRRFGLSRGQKVTFEATKSGILVKPIAIRDLTKEEKWRKNLEKEIAETKKNSKIFYSTEEFLNHLKSLSHKEKGVKTTRGSQAPSSRKRATTR